MQTAKTETAKRKKEKLKITLELLNEASVEFLETKQFIEEHLTQLTTYLRLTLVFI